MTPKPTIWTNPVHFLAFGLGSGLAPKAPGTIGTIAAIPFYLLMQYFTLWLYSLILVIAIVIGVWLCDRTSKDLKVHDHPGIVWDEFCGYWLTMMMAPTGWLWILYGFILFRIFDIWKPWPIGWIDNHISGGFGIMVDDIVAGAFALIILQLTAYLI